MRREIFNILVGAISLFMALPASSGLKTELNKEVQMFCQKMTQCTYQGLEDMSADNTAKEMADSIIEQNCQEIKQYIGELRSSSGLQIAALSCIKSMNALGCQDLANDFYTPECQKLDQLDPQ